MNNCQKFAMIMAQRKGMTYAQAVHKYPRGHENNSVYYNASQTHSSHCVHCARAEVLAGTRR